MSDIAESLAAYNKLMGKLEDKGLIVRRYIRDQKAEDARTQQKIDMIRLCYLPFHAKLWAKAEAIVEDISADWSYDGQVSSADERLAKTEAIAAIVALLL